MRKSYENNLRDDMRTLTDGLSISLVYGEMTEAEKREVDELVAALERFSEKVLFRNEGG